MAREMKCQELIEVVTDYLEKAMREEDRERFEKHLTTCPGCQNYLDQMQATKNLLGHVPPESLADGALDELMKVYRAWKKEV